ncbi:MAG TPA: hypothetical protein VGN72_24240 [Tepidisphaeraceae bacterium]|nr:hypothetical protein [Tepidisphaeraceae bacterium]
MPYFSNARQQLRNVIALLALAAAPASAAPLSVVDGEFRRDGVAYRGFGVNYYDAFLRTLRDGANTSYDAGFAALGARDIPFARLNLGGFYANDLQLYRDDKPEYFRRMDGVIASAESHGVDLVPSLFWNRFALPDLVGESGNAWGNATSQTRTLARQYATDVITRYKDSSAILMWEFGNEFNLAQDLPTQDANAGVNVAQGTPAQRTAADKISSDAVRAAIAEFAGIARSIDPGRATTTGHSVSRPAQFELRQSNTFVRDTAAEFRQITIDDHAAVDAISVHAYHHALLGNNRDQQTAASARFADAPNSGYTAVLAQLVAAADASGKSLFLGEFGVADTFDFPIPDDGNPSNDTEQRLRVLLDAYVAADVPMAALWVYDSNNAESTQLGFNVTATNSRSYQLDLLQEYNTRIVPEPTSLAAVILMIGLFRRPDRRALSRRI